MPRAIYTDGPITADHFSGYDRSVYTGSLAEAEEEMDYWLEQQWATETPTTENAWEVTPEYMQAAIRRHLLNQE